jgi:hypothetical protein
MTGGPWEADVQTVRVPDLVWGDTHLPSVIAVSRPEGNFERMMSSGTPLPVEGAIGGNVLRKLRVDWRASEQCAWIEAPERLEAEQLTQVPVVLHATPDAMVIVGVGDAAARSDLRVGDELLAVDGIAVDPGRFGDAVDVLRGDEGERRSLLVRRDGVEFDRDALVVIVL